MKRVSELKEIRVSGYLLTHSEGSVMMEQLTNLKLLALTSKSSENSSLSSDNESGDSAHLCKEIPNEEQEIIENLRKIYNNAIIINKSENKLYALKPSNNQSRVFIPMSKAPNSQLDSMLA